MNKAAGDLHSDLFTTTQKSPERSGVMLQTVSSNQCCKCCYFVDVFSYTRHLLHFCPSWERPPSHVALSGVSVCFSSVNRVFFVVFLDEG